MSSALGEGPRPVKEREAKLKALRETLSASIAEGGEYSDEKVLEAIAVKVRDLQMRERVAKRMPGV
jgi:antitoxin ParD1/3/4